MTRRKHQRSLTAENDLELAEAARAQRRQRQAKVLRQQQSQLRIAALNSIEALYWPLRKLD